jgi:hypothetical protein
VFTLSSRKRVLKMDFQWSIHKTWLKIWYNHIICKLSCVLCCLNVMQIWHLWIVLIYLVIFVFNINFKNEHIDYTMKIQSIFFITIFVEKKLLHVNFNDKLILLHRKKILFNNNIDYTKVKQRNDNNSSKI